MSNKLFLDATERHVKIYTPCGAIKETVYQKSYDENGEAYLMEAGIRDVQAEIDSHAQEVDIYNILAKAKTDPTVLARRAAEYGDASIIPETFTEAKRLKAELDASFTTKMKNAYDKFSAKEYISEADFIDAVQKGNNAPLESALRAYQTAKTEVK